MAFGFSFFLFAFILHHYSLLETVQGRLRRVAEEANYFDAVLDSMNQVQTGLESLLAEITDFDAFSSQVEHVDQELAVSLKQQNPIPKHVSCESKRIDPPRNKRQEQKKIPRSKTA